MKKRKLLRSALILILAGAVLFLAGFIVNGSAPSPLLTAEERTIVIEEPFTDIEISAGSCDIVIEKTDGPARVETKLCEALACEISVKDGVLTVTIDERMHFGLHLYADRITVCLPDGVCGSADIDITSGSISVSALSCAGHLKAETTSGSITLNAVSANDALTAKTTSGSIRMSNLSCERVLTAEATSGSITLENVTTPEDTYLTASSGSVLAKKLTARHLDAKTTSGAIKLDRVDADTLNLEATSGSVKGSVMGSKVFVCSTGSGSIHVPETTEGGLCKIKTGSGSIHIEIAE